MKICDSCKKELKIEYYEMVEKDDPSRGFDLCNVCFEKVLFFIETGCK